MAHEPKSHAAEIASGESGEQEHDDGGKKRRTDNASEEQSAAIDLSFAAAEEIDGSHGCGGSEKCGEGSEQRGEPDGKGQVRLGDESEDGPEGSTHGNAEDVGIGERIAQQGLKAGARNRERCTNNDSE